MRSLYGTVAFYACNLAYFYLYLLPVIGSRIAEKCNNVWQCSRHLKLTWLHYSIDTADGQWRDFRGSLYLLWMCLCISGIVNYSIHRVCKFESVPFFRIENCAALQMTGRLIFGIIFLFIQHGYHSIVIVLIAAVGYLVAKVSSGWKWNAAVIWVYALAILLFKESYRIKHYSGFYFLQPLFDRTYGGLYSWQLPANFLILRLISYSIDSSNAHIYHHKSDGHPDERLNLITQQTIKTSQSETAEKHATANVAGSHLNQVGSDSIHSQTASKQEHAVKKPIARLDPCHYNLLNFSAYMIYAPLYIAGPIITFDDFVRTSLISSKGGDDVELPWLYYIRWLLCLVLMEFLTNMFPLFAVLNSGLFFHLSVPEMAVAAYITLKLMWLKFLLLWRFFRLWSLVDGIDPPENMIRCMSNNYSLEQFWKGWHASFNKWIVTYLYLPLGGRNNRIMAVWAVFLFVAVWHDIELKLLIWGILNSVFFLIEVLAKRVLRTKSMQSLPPSLMHLVCSMSGALYIMVLIAVNLVGYAVGVEGISGIYNKFVTYEGLAVLTGSFYFLTVGTSLMLFLEQRQGQGQCPVMRKENADGGLLTKTKSD